MSIKVEIINKTRKYLINKTNIKNLIKHVLGFHPINGKVKVDIVFVGNKEIKKLNSLFRKINRATNVLSFVMEYEKDKILEGEIVISCEKAKDEAKKLGNNFNDYIVFLIIHGLLHILGYDHINESDRKKMEKLEEEIFDSFLSKTKRRVIEIWTR